MQSSCATETPLHSVPSNTELMSRQGNHVTSRQSVELISGLLLRTSRLYVQVHTNDHQIKHYYPRLMEACIVTALRNGTRRDVYPWHHFSMTLIISHGHSLHLINNNID